MCSSLGFSRFTEMNSDHHSFNSRTFLIPPKRFLVPLNYAHIVSGINPLPSTVSNDRRRHWHPTPVLLPGKSHGWRSLVGCSPWGRKESDTTERLHFHFSLSCIGGIQVASCVGPGKSNLPFELRRQAGDCSRVTAGPIDLI